MTLRQRPKAWYVVRLIYDRLEIVHQTQSLWTSFFCCLLVCFARVKALTTQNRTPVNWHNVVNYLLTDTSNTLQVPLTLFKGLKAPVSTYKFSKLISIHFRKELVERICSKIKVISLG